MTKESIDSSVSLPALRRKTASEKAHEKFQAASDALVADAKPSKPAAPARPAPSALEGGNQRTAPAPQPAPEPAPEPASKSPIKAEPHERKFTTRLPEYLQQALKDNAQSFQKRHPGQPRCTVEEFVLAVLGQYESPELFDQVILARRRASLG